MRIAVFTDTDFDAPSGATSTLRALVEHAPEDMPARIYTFADLEVDAPDHAAMRRRGLLRLARLAAGLTHEDVRVLHVASSGGWAGTLLDPRAPAADGAAAPRFGAMSSHRQRIRAGQR